MASVSSGCGGSGGGKKGGGKKGEKFGGRSAKKGRVKRGRRRSLRNRINANFDHCNDCGALRRRTQQMPVYRRCPACFRWVRPYEPVFMCEEPSCLTSRFRIICHVCWYLRHYQ